MASRGHRVIACAQSLLPGDKYPAGYTFSKNDMNYPDTDYCFVGLVSLEDPPKHGVREAIGKLCVLHLTNCELPSDLFSSGVSPVSRS